MFELDTDRTTLGGLACTLVHESSPDFRPTRAVILCHGFGAPANDLVGIAEELAELDSVLARTTLFVFPAAPLDLGSHGLPGGRAWWMIDMARLSQAVATRDVGGMRRDCPEGLTENRAKLIQLIDELRAQYQLTARQIILGGFSQGAMLATDVALHYSERLGGLCVLSGTLLNEAAWQTAAKSKTDLPVLQTHGRQDPILPFIGAEWLHQLLTDAGLSVDFQPFQGPHTIPWEIYGRLVDFVGRNTAT